MNLPSIWQPRGRNSLLLICITDSLVCLFQFIPFCLVLCRRSNLLSAYVLASLNYLRHIYVNARGSVLRVDLEGEKDVKYEAHYEARK